MSIYHLLTQKHVLSHYPHPIILICKLVHFKQQLYGLLLEALLSKSCTHFAMEWFGSSALCCHDTAVPIISDWRLNPTPKDEWAYFDSPERPE
jgi:hypothetical protein